jgi:hypothetical protein
MAQRTKKEGKMQCPIHQVEMVCPVCVASMGGKRGGKARTEAKKKAVRENIQKAIKAHSEKARQRAALAPPPKKIDRKTIWGIDDCRAYFSRHSIKEVDASDLIAAAPPAKKASARRYAGQRLHMLAQNNEIVQIRRGIYMKAGTP